MALLYRYSIGHPKLVVVIAAVVTLAIAPGALRLKIRTDGHALIPASAPEIVSDRSIRDEFGVEDPIVILIRSDHPDGIFNVATLTLVQDLTAELRQIEGIRPWNVFSLATEKGDRVKPGTLTFRIFLEPLPETRKELERLRDDLRAIELYTGTLVSYDERATSILVGVPAGADRTELYGTIRDVIEAKGPIPERVHVIGAPVAEALLGTHILEDLGVPSAVLGTRTFENDEAGGWAVPRTLYELQACLRRIARHIGLVPVTLAVMAIVFLLSFRSLTAVALPLSEVGACLTVVFGLMGWFGVPVYLTIAVLPVILTAIGVADEVHIFARYRDQLRDRWVPHSREARVGDGLAGDGAQLSPPPFAAQIPEPQASACADSPARAEARGSGVDEHIEALTATMAEMWVPVVKTSITTAVGFLSFALSPIGPVRAFGVFTAVGIIFCMFWSLTAIPALLALIHPRRVLARGARGDGNQVPRVSVFGRFGAAVVRYRYVVLCAALIVTVAAPFGARRIVIQDSWIDGFAPDSEFYQATQLFNEQFLGTHILLVCVDTGEHEPMTGELEAKYIEHRGMRLPVARAAGPTFRSTAGPRIPSRSSTGRDVEKGLSTLELPADLVEDPAALVGQRIYVRLPDTEAATRSAFGEPPRRRRRHTWDSRIETATRAGDRIAVTTSRRDGLPRLALRLAGDEQVQYEIKPERLTRPEVVRLVGDLEAFIETHRDEAVGGVIGTSSYISTTSFLARGRKEGTRSIPDNPHRIDWLWAQYGQVRGKERLRQAVNADYARSLVSVFMKNANFVGTRRLINRIREYEQTHLAPHDITLTFAGDVAVSQTLIDAIVTTQVRSLLASLIGILVVTAFLGRSLGWGVLCVLPCALAVLVNFAVMGYVSMPLGVATSMFAGMTLGIGVDYAIHLLERYRFSRSRGLDLEAALTDAVQATGPAIFIDALAVALGFGVLTLSQVPANARLGGLVVLSIINCFAATLLLLPALLRIRAWHATL